MTNDHIETMKPCIKHDTVLRMYLLLDHIDYEVFKLIEETVVKNLNQYQESEPRFCVFKDFCTRQLSDQKFAISIRIDYRCQGSLGTVPATARRILSELFPSNKTTSSYPSGKLVIVNVANKEACIVTIDDFSKDYNQLCRSSVTIPKLEVERLLNEISEKYGDGVRMFVNWTDTLENTLIDMLLAYESATPEKPYPQKYPTINQVIRG